MTVERTKTFVLFGATGDLAKRMLFPSLYNLSCEGSLPDGFRVIGSGRTAMETAEFHDKVIEALKPTDLYDEAKARKFADAIEYYALDTDKPEEFAGLKTMIGDAEKDGISYYLSTPPSVFAPVVAGLEAAGLTGPHTRIAMEKPIGHDLESSREVNAAVGHAFPEDQVFRVDHYLGKETVQNLIVMRFGNALFEPVWNSRHIEHVQITVAETVGLEGRVSYYDGVGALADMVQNHMLQLLALVAMEPPARYDATSVRDEKVKVLRALRPLDSSTAASNSVRGQYGSGAIDGQPVKSYAEELGKPSNTETFVAVKAFVDNWRWQGVPFYLRTGKRMPAKVSEIAIQFRQVPHSIFTPKRGSLLPNTMVVGLQPDESIRIAMMVKQPGLDRGGIELDEVSLDVSLAAEFDKSRRRVAYERLLLDLIEGDNTLFVRRDEIEAAWMWIDSIHRAWEASNLPARTYTSGTWGPGAAQGMIERDGASWRD
ncbi:Glucose-6-phosphate 1-dehydrogenase [Sphingomonas antarctica]|uniref:glucose-6-phosphate dehydrogenase n=1 Tax=Sphingomonas antarctica TaxID=2040274 RepID=UPI0039EBF3E9